MMLTELERISPRIKKSYFLEVKFWSWRVFSRGGTLGGAFWRVKSPFEPGFGGSKNAF
jgi:hypothetical protein